MDFPVNAVVHDRLSAIKAGRVLLLEGTWYLRLPDPEDKSNGVKLLELHGSAKGNVDYMHDSAKVIAIADDWEISATVEGVASFVDGSQSPGSLWLSPIGAVVYGRIGRMQKPALVRLSDGKDCTNDSWVNFHEVMSAKKWTIQISPAGHPDRAIPLLTVG